MDWAMFIMGLFMYAFGVVHFISGHRAYKRANRMLAKDRRCWALIELAVETHDRGLAIYALDCAQAIMQDRPPPPHPRGIVAVPVNPKAKA